MSYTINVAIRKVCRKRDTPYFAPLLPAFGEENPGSMPNANTDALRRGKGRSAAALGPIDPWQHSGGGRRCLRASYVFG